MKKVLPFLFVLIGFVSTAQIVNIPDPLFKNLLITQGVDTNGDGEIQATEAAAVTGTITLMYSNISDLTGIQAFINLTSFTCSGTALTSLDLSGMNNLQHLLCTGSMGVASLNVSGCTSLKDIHCPGLGLTSLNLSGLVNLEYINCSGSQNLTSLNLTGCTSLKDINCSSCNLTSLNLPTLTNLIYFSCQNNFIATPLDLSGNVNLLKVYCNNNRIPSLNVSGCTSLTELFCELNHLSSVNLTGCTGLTWLNFDGNYEATSLDVSPCTNLVTLQCSGGNITSLNANGLTHLTSINAGYNKLQTLDVSTCTSLTSLIVHTNELTYLNIKNGVVTPNVLLVNNNNLQYVCADEDEISGLQAGFTQYNMNATANSYCNFTPGGSFNTINGIVKLDIDNNGCGAGDPVLPGLIMKINDGTNTGFASNNNNGAYAFYTNAGNYTITPQTQNPYFNITPASASVNFATAGGGTQTADFCISPNGVHPDLDITLIPVTSARPGFDATYKLVYKNKGTQTLSGDVQLSFDDVKLNLVSATPAVTTQVTGLLIWTYSNLAPFESRSINIKFNFLPPPTNNINDSISFTVNITPLAADETPLDNGFELRQIVTGSFDPNDKASLEGATFDVTRVGDYAHYLIRFQNTGNAAAENVVVKDMLDNNFNWNTVELIQTSHPCILKQTLGNKLEFIFEGINLPAVTVDEPGSHGFIAFKVKTKNTLVLGDSLKNTASIYFDYNLPVITNLAGSVVAETGTIPISIEYFRGAIQAGNHLLNWKVNCTSLQVVLAIERSTNGRKYNSLGTITASNTRCLQPFDFTDNSPAAGINYYRIKMTDVDGKISYSSIIALLNKKTGFEIVNLAPNPVINGTALLNITSAEKQIINIAVSDATGKIVQAMDQAVIPGFTQINMNFSKLVSGMYTIIIFTNDQERRTTQFIKQ